MRPLKITQSITNRETPSFEKYLQDVSKLDLISSEREKELAQLIKSGNQRAKNELITANLRFVISVAKQYAGRGLSVEDLVNEGNLGLIKAAEKWDETRGIKFISYAVWWIRQSILQSLADNSSSIRLPLNQINTLNKIKTAQGELEQSLQRPATSQEISDYLDIDQDKIDLVLTHSNPLSLNTKIGDDDFILEDTIHSDDMTDDLVNTLDLSTRLELALNLLSDKEQWVIRCLFGIGCQVETANVVAKELGVSQERVRQIKMKALDKLRLKKII